MAFLNRDIVSIEDLSKKDILTILDTAKRFEKPQPELLKGKTMAALFFEPSTRTRLSFEVSMKKLGGSVIGFSNPNVTSFSKGETLWDTIKVVQNYSDIIVIRHPKEGSAEHAAKASKVPVINAGDGSNQHPTQTLIDLFTILQTQKKLEQISIAFVGDLKYGRTVHSLTKALSLFGARFYFVSPNSLKLPSYLIKHLKKKNIEFEELNSYQKIISKIDILYMTRVQKERFENKRGYEKVKNSFILKKEQLRSAKSNLKILHPLPRVIEIEKDVDATPYAYYFEQAANGVPVRQALLSLVLTEK